MHISVLIIFWGPIKCLSPSRRGVTVMIFGLRSVFLFLFVCFYKHECSIWQESFIIRYCDWTCTCHICLNGGSVSSWRNGRVWFNLTNVCWGPRRRHGTWSCSQPPAYKHLHFTGSGNSHEKRKTGSTWQTRISYFISAHCQSSLHGPPVETWGRSLIW